MSIFESIELLYADAGLNSPAIRFAATTAVAGALLYTIKPAAFFLKDGSARPFSALNKGSRGGTMFTWWSAALGLGGISAIFI